MSDDQLRQHWNDFGKYENRYCCYELSPDLPLDVNFYRNYYSDLAHMNDEELKQHWNDFGKYEGRRPCLN
jgi:hypothetical protein